MYFYSQKRRRGDPERETWEQGDTASVYVRDDEAGSDPESGRDSGDTGDSSDSDGSSNKGKGKK